MKQLDFSPNRRGVVQQENRAYGTSVLGTPLLYYPAKSSTELLVVAGIHGEEPETTFLLSRSVRLLSCAPERVAIVLCANPDGMVAGTRCNANGVDLNRNFATSNWKPMTAGSRSVLEAPRDTFLSAGIAASSEPEVFFLADLIELLSPKALLAMHAPMGCIDAPQKTALVDSLVDVFNLPWVPSIGYETPGSLGTWCNEKKIECVTLELPRLPLELLFERYGIAFAKFLSR